MDDNNIPSIPLNVDYSKVLPFQQKRIVAFINHFVATTIDFLNSFANSCELKLLNFEYKIQKTEASLLILESQLNSVDSLQSKEHDYLETPNELTLPDITEYNRETEESSDNLSNNSIKDVEVPKDPRISHYLKMLQVGVPLQAVKLKMELEGLDPCLLE